MTHLADLHIRRCTACGKLFKQEPEKQLCQTCAQMPEPPGHTPSPRLLSRFWPLQRPVAPERTPAVLPSVESMVEQQADEPNCVRCARRTAVEGSEFCLACNLDLYRSLGDAAEHLFGSLEQLDVSRVTAGLNVISAYESKRQRTATSRIDPAGARRIK